MDQKNTIVKCAKYKCLFNNCGTCRQDVITIGVDNTCQAYTETTKRGQRAKCNFIQDGVDQEIVDEIVKPFDIKPLATANLTGTTTEKWVEMCNQTKYISDWDEAATPEICRTCKKNPHNNKCSWKDVAYGVWACYEEEDNLCLSCEHCNIHGKCGFTVKPMKDINDRCCKFSRRKEK